MNIYYELHSLKRKIPRNTYKTILGQFNAGDVKGAETGIKRIKEKLRGDKNRWQGIAKAEKRRMKTRYFDYELKEVERI